MTRTIGNQHCELESHHGIPAVLIQSETRSCWDRGPYHSGTSRPSATPVVGNARSRPAILVVYCEAYSWMSGRRLFAMRSFPPLIV